MLLPEVSIGADDFVAEGFPFVGEADRPSLTYRYHDGGPGALDPTSVAAPLHGCYADLRLEGFEIPPFERTDGEGDYLRVRLEYDGSTGRAARVGFPSGDQPDGYTFWEIDGEIGHLGNQQYLKVSFFELRIEPFPFLMLGLARDQGQL